MHRAPFRICPLLHFPEVPHVNSRPCLYLPPFTPYDSFPWDQGCLWNLCTAQMVEASFTVSSLSWFPLELPGAQPTYSPKSPWTPPGHPSLWVPPPPIMQNDLELSVQTIGYGLWSLCTPCSLCLHPLFCMESSIHPIRRPSQKDLWVELFLEWRKHFSKGKTVTEPD